MEQQLYIIETINNNKNYQTKQRLVSIPHLFYSLWIWKPQKTIRINNKTTKQQNNTVFYLYPLVPLGQVFLERDLAALEYLFESAPHGRLDIAEPGLHRPLQGQGPQERDLFALAGEHAAGFVLLADRGLLQLQGLDVVEELLELGLNGRRVLGLAQNLQQIVIRNEVEAGEDDLLGFQVHVK